MKLTKEEAKDIQAYLDEHKSLVGLRDYRVIVKQRVLEADDAFVQVVSDSLEKTLTITTYKLHWDKTRAERLKDLLHELVHARISIMNEIAERHREHVEEDCVNDLTAGLWALQGRKKGK